MATEFERRSRIGDRVSSNTGMGSMIAIVAALAVAAFLFFGFYDGNDTTGTNSPGTQTSAPQNNAPTPATPK